MTATLNPPRIKQHMLRAVVVGMAAWTMGCNHGPSVTAQGTGSPSIDAGMDAGLPITVENPSPEMEVVPEPSPLPPDAGVPAPPADVGLVSLEEVAPTPRSRFPSTAMVRQRSQPADGVREQTDNVAVVSHCEGLACLDGLKDLRSGRELISLAPTRDEKNILKEEGSLERVVKIAHASESFVSAYTGHSEYSGGTHANNSLSCVTYDRHSGRPMRLKDAVTARKAQSLMRDARRKLEAFQQGQRLPAYQLTQEGFLHDSSSDRIALCADAPPPMAGTVIIIWLRQ
ncbi:hypothetical protein HMI51_02380 [Corallococcus coralloides]|nr:hypothetical protein [Corallococcus coralloides]